MSEDADNVVDAILCSLPPKKFEIGIAAGLAREGGFVGRPQDDEIEGAKQDALTEVIAVGEQRIEGAECVVVEVVVPTENAAVKFQALMLPPLQRPNWAVYSKS